jgi:hypothetical protein
LNEGEEHEKARAENEANPGLGGRAHQPKKERSGHKEQNEICERVEDHALQLCWPVKGSRKGPKLRMGEKPQRKAPGSKIQIPN